MNNNTQNNTTLSKQKKLITVLAIAAVVVAIGYFAVSIFAKDPLYTVKKYDEDGDVVHAAITDGTGEITKNSIEQELALGKGEHDVKPGETEDVLYTFRGRNVSITYRPFIIPEIALDNLYSVTVENESEKFTLKRDAISDEFVFEEAPLQTYNAQMVSKLLFQARYMLAIDKTPYEGIKLSDLGLDEESNPIKVTVSDRDGNTDTVLFGNKIVTGGAYYMKHTEKPYIYLMDTTASVYENSITAYISPVLSKTIPESESGYIETFGIKKKGERFFECEIVPEEKRTGTSSTDLHKTVYPASYSPSITRFYETLMSVASLSGDSVVEVNVSKNPEKEAILAYYGLDNPENEVSWSYKGEQHGFITSALVVDEATDAAFYYAYSEYMDVIVTLSAQNVPFLEYGLMDFVDDYAFRCNITSVSEIIVNDGAKKSVYELAHKDKQLTVTEKTTGKTIDTPSFRQFYMSLLNLRIGGYSDVDTAEGLDRELSVTVKTSFGETYEYEFYTLSTMRSFMTLGGMGEFYADRNLVNSVIEKNRMLMNGETITADY